MSESFNSVQKVAATPVAAFNSGDTQSGTEVNGRSVDLQGTTGRRYRKVRLVFVGQAVNTSNRMWNVSHTLQHSTATGAGWADLGTSSNDTTTFASSGTVRDVISAEYDLTSAERYVRFQFTPQAVTDTGGNTSATGATLTYAAVASLFDANALPASG